MNVIDMPGTGKPELIISYGICPDCEVKVRKEWGLKLKGQDFFISKQEE